MRTLFLVICLVVICFAQERGAGEGGCCFYKKPSFQDVIVCTNDDYEIKEGTVQSFFCTERFSAALLDKSKPNEPLELVGCGDSVDATTRPIPANRITIGPCSPQRRCCFYTGQNKDGDEFCLNSGAATAQELTSVQQNGKLRVAECTADYRASMVAKNGMRFDVGCGVTFDIPEGAEFSAISMTPCRESAESEAVEFTFDSEFADQATNEEGDSDFAADLSEFNIDQAFNGDELESNEFTEQFDGDDQAIGDAAIGETGEEEFNAALGDVSSESDAAIGDVSAEFDNPFAAHASAIGDTFESDFNSDSDAELSDQMIDGAEFDQANTDIEFVVDAQFSEVFDNNEDDQAVAAGDQQQNLEQSSSASAVFVSLAVVVATLAMLF